MDWRAALGIATFVLVFAGFIFGWGWKIIQDVKKSAHARIGQLEDKIVVMENDSREFVRETRCNLLHGSLDARFGKFQEHLDGQFNAFNTRLDSQFNAFNTRIDSLVAAVVGKKGNNGSH